MDDMKLSSCNYMDDIRLSPCNYMDDTGLSSCNYMGDIRYPPVIIWMIQVERKDNWNIKVIWR